MAAAETTEPIHAVLPQLEMLVHAVPGSKNLTWTDVTFADATWLLPSSEVGFVEMQATHPIRLGLGLGLLIGLGLGLGLGVGQPPTI